MLLRFPTENEIGYMFPQSDDFEDHWKQALRENEGAHRVYSDLRSVHQWIEAAQYFDEDPLEKIQAIAKNTDNFYPALQSFVAIAEWEESDGSYYNLRAAIHLLDLTFQNLYDRNWYYVTAFSLKLLVSSQRSLNYDYSLELERAVNELESLVKMNDTPLGTFGNLVRLLLDNSDTLEVRVYPHVDFASLS